MNMIDAAGQRMRRVDLPARHRQPPLLWPDLVGSKSIVRN